MPERVQRSRAKGARLPDGVVVVTRGTKWGNPYTIGGASGLACVPGAMTGEEWEHEDRISAAGTRHDFFHAADRVTRCTIRALTREEAVLLYREKLTGTLTHFREHGAGHTGLWYRGGTVQVEDVRRELAGKDLACWCPLDKPCHADFLLELANA